MSLKQRFARKALNFLRDGKEDPASTLAFPAIFGGMILGAGGFLASEFAPASHDLDTHPQSPIAVETYNTALNNLAALRGEQNSNQLISDLLPDAPATAETTVALKTPAEVKVLTRDFATALLIDKRLTEADTQDLVAQFEHTIGNFTDFTGYSLPDYGDLDIARSQPAGSTPEETAENIIDGTYNKDEGEHGPAGIVGAVLGGTAPFLCFFLFSLIGTARLNDWKDGVTSEQRHKNPKYKH